jgi:hypothetical protein
MSQKPSWQTSQVPSVLPDGLGSVREDSVGLTPSRKGGGEPTEDLRTPDCLAAPPVHQNARLTFPARTRACAYGILKALGLEQVQDSVLVSPKGPPEASPTQNPRVPKHAGA